MQQPWARTEGWSQTVEWFWTWKALFWNLNNYKLKLSVKHQHGVCFSQNDKCPNDKCQNFENRNKLRKENCLPMFEVWKNFRVEQLWMFLVEWGQSKIHLNIYQHQLFLIDIILLSASVSSWLRHCDRNQA